MRLDFGGARERPVGVAIGLLRLALCDRNPRTRRQRHRQVPAPHHRDGIVCPAAGRDQITTRKGNLRYWVDIHHPQLGTQPLRGRLARIGRGRYITCGQARRSQRRVAEALDEPTDLRCGLDRRVGRGSRRS